MVRTAQSMEARRTVFGEGPNEDDGLTRWMVGWEEDGVLFSPSEEKFSVRYLFVSCGWLAGLAVGDVAVPFV